MFVCHCMTMIDFSRRKIRFVTSRIEFRVCYGSLRFACMAVYHIRGWISCEIQISPLPPFFLVLWQRCAVAALPDRMIKQKKSMHSSAAAWTVSMTLCRRRPTPPSSCSLARYAAPIGLRFTFLAYDVSGRLYSFFSSVSAIRRRVLTEFVIGDHCRHYYAFGFRPTKPTGSQCMTTAGGRRFAKKNRQTTTTITR
ncbi:hypothetical protein AGLY_013160 [Aphis glycines]|uniref:Uncharacterized protein n=1 Tax=Aphis glycines TaxID=307491 RepID=A0A6G0T6U1_APHGL|nr:hypothetical protein AGLY_013160 [Aphis glycines]